MTLPRPEARGAVGRVVDSLRRERALTRKEFAYATGLSVTHVGHYEYRRRVLRMTMAIAWAHALGTDPAPLVRAVLQDQVAAAGVSLVVQVMEGDDR